MEFPKPINLKVDIVTDERDFFALESVWNPLLARSGVNTIFLTFEWLSTWWKHFGHRHRLFVVVVRKGKEIVALFPLMITRREGFQQLGYISNKIIDYKDFIIDAEQDREQVIRGILNTLVGAGGWDFLMLNGFPEDSVNFQAFKDALSGFPNNKTAFGDANVSPYIPIKGTWEDYWKSLKKSFRVNTSGQLNKLLKKSDTYSYEFCVNENEIDGLIDKIISLNAKKWVEDKNQGSVFDDPVMRSFYKDLSKRVFHLGWLKISAIMINKEIASVYLDFQYAQKYFHVIPSYDQKFSTYSPGRLLLVYLIQKAFENELIEFDLLGGNESYKYNFNPIERKIFTIGFFQRGTKAYFAYRWFFGIRPHLERLEESPLRNIYWWYRKLSLRKG